MDGPGAVIEVQCRNCHEPMLVVVGSAPDRERLCNSCVCAFARVTTGSAPLPGSAAMAGETRPPGLPDPAA